MKLLLTLCLASLLTVQAEAARRIGEAEVRIGKNNLPCFTITDREEKRSGNPDFQSVTVAAGQRTMWRMAMPRERTFPLAFSMCIPYGGRVQALPQTPAAELAGGIVYTVRIDTRPGKSAAAPLRYDARFCLARGSSGGTAVVQAGAGSSRGSACGQTHAGRARLK
ncbi:MULTISPECIES: hypothetical protein [unclassified Massilia]|uniref:hypothetical protein n=1 Tax=unclassified Massilia TaxID=2609279 RepID=UPI0017817F8C|nr:MULTISPECIES: hypothetical protein [unclassified Massilia]MBD8528898.1 hypothetical protein [Massilia sp. CFBP 13647]MBD8673540.1 hypothetical protein [Massilia sp. CFBP 13721]